MKNNPMKRIATLIIVLFFYVDSFTQCVACKAVVESEINNGNMSAEGINKGILYLMIIPYLLIIGVGIIIYKNHIKNRPNLS